MKEEEKKPGTAVVPGLAILGCLLTGLVGLVQTFVTQSSTGLMASAIAFGVVAYVSFR